MIRQVLMYTVICDSCGKDVNEYAEYSCWSDRGLAEGIAFEANWEKVDDMHYCPDCYTYDDDDNPVPVTNKEIK